MSSSAGNEGVARRRHGWLIAAAVGFVILLVVVGWTVATGNASDGRTLWFSGLLSIGILALSVALLGRLTRDVGTLVIGKDKRVSTSKLQALVWTFALVGVLLTIILANFHDVTEPYLMLFDSGDGLPDEYLILLGGPFAAAVAAKAIVTSKVDDGKLTKTSGDETADAKTRAGEAFSDDEGNADLIDSQYLLFNLLALVYFIGAFIDAPKEGLPQIPDVLVALTSVSAATYVSNKATARDTPVITGLVPERAGNGDPVTVYGRNLLREREGGGAYFDLNVLFGGVPATPLGLGRNEQGFLVTKLTDPESVAFAGSSGDDRLVVEVPPGAPAGPIKVTASNYKGVRSEPHDFEVTG